MTKTTKNPETIALHGGEYRSDPATTAVAVPIYRTTSYQFKDTDTAANLFALKEFGNIYTRIMNPTCDALEKRVAALEGGLAALAVSSGQSASAFSILNVAQSGDNFISSTDLYGGTVNLFNHTLKKQGIVVRYADPLDPKNFEKLINDQTIHGGMIPKIKTCIEAVNNGVRGVVIIDGRRPHSILFELFSDLGAGTLIRK